VNASFADVFFEETRRILDLLDHAGVERLAEKLARVRQGGGRLFLLGVGGSAASASHAANDFRKLAGFEAYCPTDNVAELTARANDEGWDSVFAAWLAGSRLAPKDCLLVFSVGGGDAERNISANLVKALDYAKRVGATVTGIVGRDGGHTSRAADICVLIPAVSAARVTPHTEAFHGVIWHLLVSHPALKTAPAKWESEGS
jgi:D-sedoheptulose 7-phosphate isomerase